MHECLCIPHAANTCEKWTLYNHPNVLVGTKPYASGDLQYTINSIYSYVLQLMMQTAKRLKVSIYFTTLKSPPYQPVEFFGLQN